MMCAHSQELVGVEDPLRQLDILLALQLFPRLVGDAQLLELQHSTQHTSQDILNKQKHPQVSSRTLMHVSMSQALLQHCRADITVPQWAGCGNA